MSHLGNLCVFCWKILSSESFNEPYASVFLGCVLLWSQNRGSSQQLFPKGQRALLGPHQCIPQSWLLSQLPLLVEKLQHAAFSKCQTKLLGEERSKLCFFFPHSLSCHFVNLKSKTSLLHKNPDNGIETITLLLITRYKAQKNDSS